MLLFVMFNSYYDTYMDNDEKCIFYLLKAFSHAAELRFVLRNAPTINQILLSGVAPILPKSIGECRRQKEERRGIEEGERGKKGKEKLKKKEERTEGRKFKEGRE